MYVILISMSFVNCLTQEEKSWGWLNTINGPPKSVIILVTKIKSLIGSI